MKSREFRIVNLKCWLTFLVLSAFVLSPDNIKAQKQWNVELRPGIDFPIHTSHGNKNIGFGMEGKAICTLLPGMGAYAGWGWNLFPAENRSAFRSLSGGELQYLSFGVGFLF